MLSSSGSSHAVVEAVTPVGWAGGWASWADAGDIRMNKRQATAGKARIAFLGYSIQQIPLPRAPEAAVRPLTPTKIVPSHDCSGHIVHA